MRGRGNALRTPSFIKGSSLESIPLSARGDQHRCIAWNATEESRQRCHVDQLQLKAFADFKLPPIGSHNSSRSPVSPTRLERATGFRCCFYCVDSTQSQLKKNRPGVKVYRTIFENSENGPQQLRNRSRPRSETILLIRQEWKTIFGSDE